MSAESSLPPPPSALPTPAQPATRTRSLPPPLHATPSAAPATQESEEAGHTILTLDAEQFYTPTEDVAPGDGKKQKDMTESELAAHKFNQLNKGIYVRKASAMPLFNHISTGIFAVDLALLGGIPENIPFLYYGKEDSCKTTELYRIAAAFQRKYPEMRVALCDAETAFDPVWARKNGVDLDRVNFLQPETGEMAVDFCVSMLSCDDISFVGLDSIAALVPIEIRDKSAEDAAFAPYSKLIGRLMSQVVQVTAAERYRDHRPTFGAINQQRANTTGYGSPNTLFGGRQLRYQTHTWIHWKGKKNKGKDQFGVEVDDHIQQSFSIDKQKVGASISSGEFRRALNPSGCADTTLPKYPKDHPHAGELVRVESPRIYEAPTILQMAKRLGFVTGESPKNRISGVDIDFRRGEDMEIFLYENPEHDLRLRQLVIAEYRRQNKLPPTPPDGYLLSWDSYL